VNAAVVRASYSTLTRPQPMIVTPPDSSP
jgi:hypothetical protein